MESLDPILRAAARSSDFKPSLSFFCEIWPAVVPETFVSHSSPCGWDGQTLHVEVSEDWLLEFRHHRRELLVRLRNTLPWDVTSLEFIPTVRAAKARDQVQAPEAPRPEEIPVNLPDLGDEQLNQLAQSIGGFIARKNRCKDENS